MWLGLNSMKAVGLAEGAAGRLGRLTASRPAVWGGSSCSAKHIKMKHVLICTFVIICRIVVLPYYIYLNTYLQRNLLAVVDTLAVVADAFVDRTAAVASAAAAASPFAGSAASGSSWAYFGPHSL